MPGRDPGGFIITMLLGIVGAVIGGMIGRGARVVRPERRRRVPDVAPRIDHSAGAVSEAVRSQYGVTSGSGAGSAWLSTRAELRATYAV